MTKLEKEIELEKTVLEKVNRLLEHHWSETRNLQGFYFFLDPESKLDRIRVDGCCIGRRFWKSLLQVVNAFADSASYFQTINYSSATEIYKPFRGLGSKSLEELAIKVDLALQDISRNDGLHKYRILCTSSS